MLPNLPGLSGQWITSRSLIPMDPAAWVQIAQSDPMRWTIAVTAPLATGILLWTTPDDVFVNGFDLLPAQLWERKYKDYGDSIQGEWWIYGKGFASNVVVELVSIRPPGNLIHKEV